MDPLGSIANTIEVLRINFRGGIDVTKHVLGYDPDERLNYVWNNLLNDTTKKLTKLEVEIILEIQDEFFQKGEELYTRENADFIIKNLKKVDILNVNKTVLDDLFDALMLFEKKG